MFRDVLGRYRGALLRIARSHARADGDHEDLYQEILCQLWRSLPSFRGDAAMSTWVYRVALNTALTHRRREAQRVRLETGAGAREAAPAVSNGEPRQQAAILADFLASLGGVDRAVLILYMEGLSHRETADVTGQSAGAVAVRLHRLKAAFKRRYLER
jgi:RNA polymerase sigma-70 factor (ECF subfamily)